MRNRKTDQVDRPPRTCAEYDISDPEVLQACNEALCLADEQVAEGTTQDFCVSRCRDSYTAAPNGMCVREAGGTDPASGNPFLADSYKRRNPFVIAWGDTMAATSVTESDWDTFVSAGASDVPSLTVNPSDITTPAPLTFNFDAAPTTYTGSDMLVEDTGSLNFSAQSTLANGDTLLLAQDGDKVVAYDATTNSFRQSSMGNLVGAFVSSAWDSYTAASGYSVSASLVVGSVISLSNAGLTLVANGGRGVDLTSEYGYSQFIVTDAGNGNIALQNNTTGTFLSVCNGCISQGFSVDVHEGVQSSSGDTTWTVYPVAGGVALKNALSGTYLTPAGITADVSSSAPVAWAVTTVA